jgi:uncharacterized membrane protein YphA (DoxX/SURF4 family)
MADDRAACSSGLAAIFLCAGSLKFVRLPEFETALRRYEIVPASGIHVAELAVAAAEVCLGAALAVGSGT